MTTMHSVRSSASYKAVLRLDDGGVATPTLNGPAQFKALSQTLLAELEAAIAALTLDRMMRVVVIAGAIKSGIAK